MNKGTIVTFYSYKGGVGRTFALANIGALLSLWGYKTLCVDWDLEAPGLHLYFKRFMSGGNHIGLVEMIQDHADGKNPCWQDYTTEVSIPDAKQPLLLVSAGLQDASYVERMQALDWTDLYGNHNFGNFLEALREDWKETLDFVLVDSRTGISDIGGICTVQLPDILALLFTANDQSLYGGIDIAKRARRARASLPIDLAKLVVLPIAARFEGRVEVELADEWLKTFEKELALFFNEWSHRETPIADLLNFTRIPYVPYWSFGEKLPVIDKGTKNPDDIGFSLETLAALVAQQLCYSNVLVGNRDTFVISAKNEPIGSVENVPYARNPYFTGRETVLRDLHEALSSDSATALTQGYAISGLGGIGKTQTAVEYSYRYRSEYRFIFWTRADTEVALQAGFVEIAKLLDLPEQNATNPANTVQAVRHWLEHTGEWLLIFDNADAPEMLKASYPRQPKGHILLTSRAQFFDTLGIARPLALEKMQPDEALSFLYTRTERAQSDPAEKNAAAHLAAELGYLPLALEQAAAYITAKTARFQDYLASYKRQRIGLLNEAQPKTGEYPASVASTWALNFQEVEQDPVAADILRVSAFLSPDAIPLELLSSGASQLGPVLAGALSASEDPLALNEALEPLTRYSLIRRDVDAQTYSINRMVQEVVKDQVGVELQAQWAERTVRAVAQSFPEVDYRTWTRCERYIPQVLLCAAQMDRWSMTFPEARDLLSEAGLYFYQRGQFWEAEPLWKSALAMCEQVLGPEHPDTLSSLDNLALLYNQQGKYEQAEPLFHRALATRERVLGPEHPDTLSSLNNLAILYRNQGKYEQAEPLYQRALEASERVLGPDHPGTASSLNNLAILYRNQGKFEEAEPLFYRALATRERVLGPEHPDTLGTINNLAALYDAQGKYEQAEPLYQRALATREWVLGPEHPDTASTLDNLASLYHDQGKYEQAEPLYQRALSIRERVLGPDHPGTASTLNNLAILYEEEGKFEEAEPLFHRALATRERVLGPEHPGTVQVRENYTDLLQKMKKGTQVTDPQD